MATNDPRITRTTTASTTNTEIQNKAPASAQKDIRNVTEQRPKAKQSNKKIQENKKIQTTQLCN